MKNLIITIAAIAAATFTGQAQLLDTSLEPLLGNWKGALQIPPMEMRIFFRFEQTNGKPVQGFMISPDQSGTLVPMSQLDLVRDALTFEIPQMRGGYTGRLDRATRQIKGTWTQVGTKFPLDMAFTEGDWKVKRPQTPKPPFPYREEQITFENKKHSVKLAGTLTLPPGKGPFAAVILVSGSGPQDRNETLFEHRPFAVIADFLTRAGYAVLRYDDRGFGKSTGNFAAATTEDFSHDAEAALDFLKTRAEVNPRRIGYVGHSEGGVIAPMIAAWRNDVAFAILLAGPGISGEEIFLRQAETFSKAMGYSEEFIQKSRPLSKEAVALMKSDAPAAEMETKMKSIRERSLTLMGEADRKLYEKNKHLEAMNSQRRASPWIRFYARYDPAPDLRRVKCPVLALNGEKDTQVLPKENLAALEKHLKAGGNKNVTIREFSGLNHLFQTAKTGEPKEYVEIEETFNEAVLKEMLAWLKKLP